MRVWTIATSIVITALFGVSCRSSEPPEKEPKAPAEQAVQNKPLSAKSAKPPAASHLSKEAIQKTVNPEGLPPYAGRVGIVHGVVRATGDRPPVQEKVLERIPEGECEKARQTYGRLFREGPGRALADVLVTATGYDGYVPAKTGARRIIARGCAFERRTIALTFGQRLEVISKDGESYIPELLGAKNHALMVAMPGGDAVQLFPREVGQYRLKDNAHDYATADVFVLRYPTMDVTGLDGTFRIEGVPVGKVTVSAYLPQTGATVQKEITVTDDGVRVDFEMPFDAGDTPGSP